MLAGDFSDNKETKELHITGLQVPHAKSWTLCIKHSLCTCQHDCQLLLLLVCLSGLLLGSQYHETCCRTIQLWRSLCPGNSGSPSTLASLSDFKASGTNLTTLWTILHVFIY